MGSGFLCYNRSELRLRVCEAVSAYDVVEKSETFLEECVISVINYVLLLCRRSKCTGGSCGGGAGSDRPADRGLAGYSHSLPGSPPQLGHHLLSPHLSHPPQTVGKDHRCWRAAEHTLLKKGTCDQSVKV